MRLQNERWCGNWDLTAWKELVVGLAFKHGLRVFDLVHQLDSANTILEGDEAAPGLFLAELLAAH